MIRRSHFDSIRCDERWGRDVCLELSCEVEGYEVGHSILFLGVFVVDVVDVVVDVLVGVLQ